MANGSGPYRQLHLSFWQSTFVEELDPTEKLLYLYMISSPKSNMEGVYKTTIRRISFETGIERDAVVRVARRFEEAKKGGILVEGGAAWVVVCEAPEHMTGSPSVQAHFRKTIDELPDRVVEYLREVGYPLPDSSDISKPSEADTVGTPSPHGGYTLPHIRHNTKTKTKTKTKTRHGTRTTAVHEATGLPMNQTRYDNLCGQYGKPVIDDYMAKIERWLARKGKEPYRDCAAAVKDWLDRDEVDPRAPENKILGRLE